MEELTKALNLEEFFIERVREAAVTQKTCLSADVEFYLVHLLTHFAKAVNFFQTTPEGRVEDRPLALKLYDATFDEKSRYLHLKSLGDTALYSAGVFFDGLGDRRGKIDYYITMGAGAYTSLANMATHSEKRLGDIFDELAQRFPDLVEIVNMTCEGDTDRGILKLIEHWRLSGSQRAREKLVAHGISPDTLLGSTKVVQ
jgi:hypothetical protein